MKYYIVALLDKDSCEELTPIKRKYSKKFKANRNSPTPFIALNVIDTPNIEKVSQVIEKVLKPYKKFKVELNNSIAISEPLKTVNLKLQNRGYIKKIHLSLKENFELNGLSVKFTADDNIAISLATLSHINKNYENDIACDESDLSIENKTYKVSKLELWKLSNNKKEYCVKSFPLRNF